MALASTVITRYEGKRSMCIFASSYSIYVGFAIPFPTHTSSSVHSFGSMYYFPFFTYIYGPPAHVLGGAERVHLTHI